MRRKSSRPTERRESSDRKRPPLNGAAVLRVKRLLMSGLFFLRSMDPMVGLVLFIIQPGNEEVLADGEEDGDGHHHQQVLHGGGVLHHHLPGKGEEQDLHAGAHVMAAEHFEKADDDYRGLYQVICSEFCKRLPEEIVYVNREEDMGLENLRKAKEALRPDHKEVKYGGCFLG